MVYMKNNIKYDRTPSIFVLSKQKKPLIRIRTGITSDHGPNNTLGVFKNDTQEVQNISTKILSMNKEIKTIPELLLFGYELEKMFPKNSITYDLKDDDTDVNMLINLNMDLEKYNVLKGFSDLGKE